MIFAIKNFRRLYNCVLTAKSVRHFCQDEIYLFNFTDNNFPLEVAPPPFVGFFEFETKYVLGPGRGSKVNGFYYTEALNAVQGVFEDLDDKVVFIDEDHFFTNGKTIQELKDNEFDLAVAAWPSPDRLPNDVNASIVCFNPSRLRHLFPLEEKESWIESVLGEGLVSKADKIYWIKNRKGWDYCGDGEFTNDAETIERKLKEAGII